MHKQSTTDILEQLFSTQCFEQEELTEFINDRIHSAINKTEAIQECIHKVENLRIMLDEGKFLLRLYEFQPLSLQTDENSYYSMDEACKLLNISRSKLRSLIDKGTIEAFKKNQRVFQPCKWSVNVYKRKLQGLSSRRAGGIHSFIQLGTVALDISTYTLLREQHHTEVYLTKDSMLKTYRWLNRRKRRLNKLLKE